MIRLSTWVATQSGCTMTCQEASSFRFRDSGTWSITLLQVRSPMRSSASLRGSRTQAAGHDAGHLAGGHPAHLFQQADLFCGAADPQKSRRGTSDTSSASTLLSITTTRPRSGAPSGMACPPRWHRAEPPERPNRNQSVRRGTAGLKLPAVRPMRSEQRWCSTHPRARTGCRDVRRAPW